MPTLDLDHLWDAFTFRTLLSAMANPSQLYLLADHIKLSLLERQRAISLDLEPTAQDGHISRSLDSMREGIEAIEQEEAYLEENGDSSVSIEPTSLRQYC